MLYVQAGVQAKFWVQVSATACLLYHWHWKSLQGSSVECNMAFINPYLGIVNPAAQLSGNINTWLSIRDAILLHKILSIAPSSRNMKAMENWWSGRQPMGFNSWKSAHVYAWPPEWTVWLLLLTCSQWSILPVGTSGGSHAGNEQEKENTLRTQWMGQKIPLQALQVYLQWCSALDCLAVLWDTFTQSSNHTTVPI